MAKKTATRVERRVIRASAIPRAILCGQSAERPEVLIDSSGESSAAGRAVHAVMADIVRGNLDAVPALEPYAQRFKVEDVDALRMLAWGGLSIWQQYRDKVGVQIVEEELVDDIGPSFAVSGHPDLIGTFEDDSQIIPVVFDWKSRDSGFDYFDQLLTYLRLVWKRVAPDATHAKIIIAYLAERRTEIRDVTLDDLTAWEEQLKDSLSSNAYCPGEHCDGPGEGPSAGCARRLECMGRAQLVRAAVQDFSVEEQIRALTRDKLAELYPRRCAVKKAVELFDAAMHDALKDGPLPLADGRMLSRNETSRDTIFAEPAIAAIAEDCHTSPDSIRAELSAAITVKKNAIEDFAAARAGRGAKGAARERIVELLRNTPGAMTTTKYFEVRPRKGA